MKAIQAKQCGSPDVMQLADLPVPQPGPQDALVKTEAIGVNFIDVYHRTGLYKLDLPMTPGMEAAGVVEAVGAGVTSLKPGDRVAYAMALGAYAEYQAVPAVKLVRVPDGVTMEQAAAAMLQGMTAHYLTNSTYVLKPGHTALVHAAAGGAGQLLVQMARNAGARVIGTVSTEAKAAIAREAGCDEVILYSTQDFEAETRQLTGGKGVEVVYDSVGQTTYLKSFNCLKPRGLLVLFGQSSGAVPPIDPLMLSSKGSLYVTRPTLAHHLLTREEVEWRAGEVLNGVKSGRLRLRIEKKYPLAEAPQAHRDLESRKLAGKLLLIPG
jgi:NADPH:quinone reductase